MSQPLPLFPEVCKLLRGHCTQKCGLNHFLLLEVIRFSPLTHPQHTYSGHRGVGPGLTHPYLFWLLKYWNKWLLPLEWLLLSWFLPQI